MSSRIGRKSSFSKEFSELKEPQNGVKEGIHLEKEVISGIVLDICSSYKPYSIFIDDKYLGYKNFETGIFIIVGLYGHEKIAVVAWRKSEDELRTNYGSDENIIGRECSLATERLTSDALLKAEIMFNKTLSSQTKGFNQSEYMSNSFFSNSSTNYLDQIKGVSKSSGLGEVWREVKPR